MYIRRKVFSVLTDEMGEERLYSVNETLFEGYEVDELDERMYAQTVDGSGVSMSSIKKSWDSLTPAQKSKFGGFKDFYSKQMEAINKANTEKEVAKVAARNANKANPGRAAAESMKNRVNLKQALKNTWKNSGKLGKAGMITVPVATAGALVAAGRASKRNSSKKD